MKFARLLPLLLTVCSLAAGQVVIDTVTYEVVPSAELLVLRRLPASQPTTEPTTQPTPNAATMPLVSSHPSAATTGVPSEIVLKPDAGVAIKPGGVYEGFTFTGTKTIRLAKDQTVTFRHCRFDGNGSPFAIRCDDNLGKLIIDRCEITNATAAGVYGEGFEVTNSFVHQIAGDGFKPICSALIAGNYVTELGWKAPAAHADGVQIESGADIRITGNYFDMPRNVADTKSNAALFLQGQTRNVVFNGNFCRGGNFTVHAWVDGDGGPTIHITGNTFYAGSSQYGFGSIGPGVVWRDNVNEASKPVSKSDK